MLLAMLRAPELFDRRLPELMELVGEDDISDPDR